MSPRVSDNELDFFGITLETAQLSGFNLFSVGERSHGVQDWNAVLLNLNVLRTLTQNVQNNIVLRMRPGKKLSR